MRNFKFVECREEGDKHKYCKEDHKCKCREEDDKHKYCKEDHKCKCREEDDKHEYCKEDHKCKCREEDDKHEYCKEDHKHELKPMVLTTGVLNTVVDQTAAHIEVVNLDPVETFQVRVQVIQWLSGTPIALFNQLITLLPNQHINLTQNTPTFHYEVRIFHPGSPNVIANTFAINAGTFTLPGLTFNQKDLMKLDTPFI